MTSLLQEFYANKELRNNVHEYLVQYLRDKAVTMVFERGNTDAIADAKEVVDDAFANLEVMFASKPKKRTINETR